MKPHVIQVGTPEPEGMAIGVTHEKIPTADFKELEGDDDA